MLPVVAGRALHHAGPRRRNLQHGTSWIEYLLITGVVSVGAVLAFTSGLPDIEEGFCRLRHRIGDLVANTSSIAVCGSSKSKPAPPATTSGGPPVLPSRGASGR